MNNLHLPKILEKVSVEVHVELSVVAEVEPHVSLDVLGDAPPVDIAEIMRYKLQCNTKRTKMLQKVFF